MLATRKKITKMPGTQGGRQGRPPAVRVEMQEFARRLYRLMAAKGWTQADLARAAFGTMTDSRGYKVPKQRDRVSVYLSGKSLPERRHLEALAKALGTTAEDLAPSVVASRLEQEAPRVSAHESSNKPGYTYLTINALLPSRLAARIVLMIQEADHGAHAVTDHPRGR